MLVDINKLKWLPQLIEIQSEVKYVIDSMTHDELKAMCVANDWSHKPTSPSFGNWNFSLYNKHWIVPNPPDILMPVNEKIGKIDDCFQAFVNFMRPNSVLPVHADDESEAGNMGTLRSAGLKCYQISCGIQVPSDDPELCGLNINGQVVPVKQGEIIAFDGSVPHNGWNKTDQYRVTLIFDMYKTGFTN